jgi:hypothetical protein
MSMHKGMLGPDRNPGSVSDVTLADYVQRKTRQEAFNSVQQERKLTFEEWYKESGWFATHTNLSLDDADSSKYIMMQAWKAAQENT